MGTPGHGELQLDIDTDGHCDIEEVLRVLSLMALVVMVQEVRYQVVQRMRKEKTQRSHLTQLM